MQQAWGRVKLTEVNPHLVCVLCHGYFIDATTMAECPHSFCRSCIILYLETKSYCPICEVQIHKTKPHLNLKPDKTLQDIVYKLVPGLFHSEMRRRREFYAKHPNHDLYLNPEARGVGVERIIYSPEDSISLSLEYYDDEREREEWTSAQPGLGDIEKKSPNRPGDGLKRYLQCPAVVTISQIKKFIRMKYNLSATCTVEVLYRRESLPDSYSLMDIAYIYTWKKNGPMRFYYRIHVSVPVAQTLPALEKPKITEETGTKLEDPSLVKLTKSAIESSLCADDINTSPIVRKSEDTNCIPSENQSKVEDNSAIIRPYASEHDELSVSLLLSLSNGHQRETNVESETDKKQSEHTNIKSTPAIGTLNNQIPAISQKLKNVESKIEASKTMPTVQSVSSPGTVNGYNQHSKTNKAIVNGPTKLFVKKSIPKPPIKCNASVKNNGQIIKNILATKLTENSNKSLPKSIQITGEAITNTTRDQNKTPPEGKQLHEENKSNLDAHIACQTTSQKQLTIAEKVLKSTKYLPSSLIKNNLKKIDSVNNIASLQKSEFNPDKVMSTPINKPMLENKDLSCAENKTISITTNHQEKNETKAKETTSNNIQPIHRKEINRLEQIVKNCMKKGNNSMLNKQTESNLSNGQASKMENGEEAVKQTSPQNSSSKDGLSSSSHTMINCPNKELAAPLEVDTAKEKTTILKRKLKDPTCFISVNRDNSNLLGPPDPKKRRLVTPDVSIELTTNPAHENKKNPFIRPAECSDLSILTKRFLNSIQQMKKHTNAYQEFNIKDIDQLCASNVKIEKVPASHVNSSSHKILQNTLVKNEEKDKPTTDNKDNLKHKKKDDLVSIAIERINENIRMTEKSNDVTTDTQENKETINPEPVPSTSGDKESLPSPSSLKKLPRLIEINAPPRPKLQTTLQDSKQRTGLKMTTVRKEVPIGKEGPLVRKDNTGALDLSSGSPGSPKHKPATNQRPSSLSPLQAMSSFQVPEMKTLPPLRIPNLKHKTPPLLQPRPSSLSSSSPSPPADSRTSELFSSTAFQHLYRHQLELQSRLMASSQINNTKWRQDPLSAKKFEEWMRNVMNCGGLPPHPLMFQSQLGSSSDTHRK